MHERVISKLVLPLTVAVCLLGIGSAGLATLSASAPGPGRRVEPQATVATPARVSVLAIASAGKFLGDDIGGAMISIRDARTQELLAAGRTQGGSGMPDLPETPLTRLEPVPVEGAAVFETTVMLDGPRLVEVTGYGPLAAQGAATKVSTTKWLLPTSQGGGENRVLLHFPGLIVQILSPPTHFLPATPPPLRIDFRANVTMMCGCPVGPETPWKPEDYQVTALITGPSGTRHEVPLRYDFDAPDKTPSQFVGSWVAPTSGVYEAVVTAYQRSYDNTGVDHVTFVLP
jgi:hypothetical protein